uniref:Uncharacterized protein n=1 Tax=Pseudo-nitzschia australis TaxID=44445 RepID=A0A7S4AXP3_9STRA|mmetsp:Transcript_1487/g.3296  ORF Transcript_1487/g.3296 Transcript_1487/m.3296 type:complete len:117 (+) Transcript_1487:165-515(+)
MGCQTSKDAVLIDYNGVVIEKPDDCVVGCTICFDTDDEDASSSVITIASSLEIDAPKNMNRSPLYRTPAVGCRKYSKLRKNREINRRKQEYRERQQRVAANRIAWEQQKQSSTVVQ